MTTHTTSRYYVSSWSGLIFAGIAGIAATSLIVHDAFPNGWTDWSHVKLEHALAPAIVAITAFLWLHAAREAREGKLGALLLAGVALFCSGLIIFESMGRGAEALDTQVKASEKTVSEYAAILANLDRANKLTAEAESWVANECKTGLGPKCRGVTFTFEQRKAYAEKLQKDAEAHKAPPPVDARGDRVAFIAGLLGYNGETAKKAAQSLYPLARPLAFEFVMILLLHASVRTREVSVPVSASVSVSEPKALSFERPYTDEEIEELTRILNGMGQPLTNDEVASALRISKSEASKRVQKAVDAGKVVKLRAGRFNQISLVA